MDRVSIFPCFNSPRLLCLVDSTSTDLSRVADGPTWRAKARARLLSLDLHDFKSIRRRNFQLEGRSLSCLVGCNSSGKSAILDALRFALCRHCDRNLRDYIRRGKPITSAARVTAQFRYEQEADEGSIQGERSLNLQMFWKKHWNTFTIWKIMQRFTKSCKITASNDAIECYWDVEPQVNLWMTSLCRYSIACPRSASTSR